MSVTWNITDGSFAGVKFHVAVPDKKNFFGVMSQDVTNERRLQISEKPLVDGAEVEDFGQKARTFSAEVIFFGADYIDQLKTFEAALNSGKTGVLILPDLDEAVNAKYQRHTRKSTSQDGNSTVLSVSWVEDGNAKVNNPLRSQSQARNALASGETLSALPSISDSSNVVLAKAAAASATLSANSFLKAVATAENAVTSARQSINAITNIPKNIRQSIISTVQRVQLEISTLQQVVKGILNLTDLLNLGLSQVSPTRFNTGLGLADYTEPDIATTAVVTGNAQVVPTVTPTPIAIQSYPEAKKHLEDAIAAVAIAKASLETQAQGQTSDFSVSAIQLINSVKDIIGIIDTTSTRQVITNSQTSFLEVCFQNGLTVSDIDTVYRLNTNILDPLDIPAFTVINL